MIYSALLGTGSYLPKRMLSNDELSKQVDTSHEWIVERTGIESRHIANTEETTTFMAIESAKDALLSAKINPTEIDLIIVATCTPDSIFPPTACLIQEALGVPPCPAFDIQVACSGFIYGVTLVDQFIRSRAAKKALLIGSETMSRVVDWQDRRTCILFGDGAGAAIFGASETPGILGTHLAADGRDKDVLTLKNAFQETIDMQGNPLFKLAVNKLDKIAAKMLSDHNLSVQDLDWLVPHQANIRILKATAEKLGLPVAKVILTLAKQGNTSAASIPLALDSGVKENKIKKGQLLLLEAFGAGLTWGTALIRY
jgi:3-oxoacyl-[acyl-carrier-protein] synthase-3